MEAACLNSNEAGRSSKENENKEKLGRLWRGCFGMLCERYGRG
jgi:hypothetical protein